MNREKKQNTTLQIANNDKQINNIYGMISKQEDTITYLLNKYKDQSIAVKQHNSIFKQRSQTIDISYLLPTNVHLKNNVHNQSQSTKSRYSSVVQSRSKQKILNVIQFSDRDKYSQQEQFILPNINKRQVKPKKSVQLQAKRKQQQLSLRIQRSQERKKIDRNLYRIYGNHGLNRIQPKKIKQTILNTKLQPVSPQPQLRKKQLPINKQEMQRKINKRKQHEQVQSNDQSSEQQITLMHYQSQFRQKLRGQCIEEINFLYFSRNEAMKNWTESLLSLFEKHDKQITSLRIKSRYLYHFDDQFWTMGVYNTDDI